MPGFIESLSPGPAMKFLARALVLLAVLGGAMACGGRATNQPSPTALPVPESSPQTAIPTRDTASRVRIQRPPAGYLYHGVYPGGYNGVEDAITPADLKGYVRLAGKPAAWVYFSDEWAHGKAFPIATASWIRSQSSVPYIRLMLRSTSQQNQEEPHFTLGRIIDGAFDKDLTAWCRSARDFGTPLLVEYGTEVNGDWFPWNGRWNGAGATDTYGDPARMDGPERFRDAYRHIIGLCRQAKASNITWVFHVNATDSPKAPWNKLELYYPGDEWIDWLAVSVYGAQTPTDQKWLSFGDQMDLVYPRLRAMAPGKPIIVAEFGMTKGNPDGDQAAWADRGLSSLLDGRWSDVIGFSWWNEAWHNDEDPAHDSSMRLQDSPELAAVFQRRVGAADKVLGKLLLATAP